jgi:hypothetical protein
VTIKKIWLFASLANQGLCFLPCARIIAWPLALLAARLAPVRSVLTWPPHHSKTVISRANLVALFYFRAFG